MTADGAGRAPTPGKAKPHHGSVADKLNWLRAAVLGANDGIVSTAGIVVGVAAASADRGPLFTAGLAGLVAGALSMAVGEYVSVSTARDTEQAMLDREEQELQQQPDAEMDELVGLYEARGLSPQTARQAAAELTAFDPLAAHAEVELRIDPENLTNPWLAAFSSAASFTVGALLPFLAILIPPPTARVPVTAVVVLLALAATGWVAARLGGAKPLRPILRVTVGGGLAMAITFGIGHLVGVMMA
ncbi:VIT1/CCC1 transporter family protein [Mycobacterium sp. NPDC050041]|uniref:VIT1/CCC1 transporter family protein n=1 Tax=Mycobacterium sp. NPDC050041 TaxID=3364293 RepID=UPI003C2DADDE